MPDRSLAGNSTVGVFTPTQLYAGEPNGHTTQGRAASGHLFGQLNDQGHTFKFAVVALVAGLLVPWNPAASDSPSDYATGTVTFSVAVPSADETVTINGEVITFKAAADPDEFEVTIGATLAETAANLAAFINDHRNEFGFDGGVTATSAAGVTTVRAPGVAGDAVTLAEAGANIAVSGATLSGGEDDDAEIGGAAKIYGVLPHALDTTATGYNAEVDTPVLIGGDFNFAALDVPEGTTLAEMKAHVAGTPIDVKNLY